MNYEEALKLLETEEEVQQEAAMSVIRSGSGKYAYILRHKDGQTGFPCGKVDPGEEVLSAAYRELQEETGLKRSDLDGPLSYIDSIQQGKTMVHIYASTVPIDLPLRAGQEPPEGDLYWETPDNIRGKPSRFQAFNIVTMERINGKNFN